MTAAFTIDPRGMEVREWTDAMSINLDFLGPMPHLINPAEWRCWGTALLSTAALGGIIIPNPYEFSEWREWAARANQTLDNAET